MLCPSCKKREATIHITQNVNGKTTRIDLCPVCANEQGYLGEPGEIAPGFFSADSFGGPGLNLFKMAGGMSGLSESAVTGERCAYCGTSFEEFRNRGLLGCCHCYEEFGERLLPVIRRIQAGETHTGRRPAGAPAVSAKPEGKPAQERKHLLKRPVRIAKKQPEEPPAQPAAASGTPVPAPSAAAAPVETELEKLRREQVEAVKSEDYEKAARIRDRIRALDTAKEGGTKA
jgi:protein arginine kinase activator